MASITGARAKEIASQTRQQGCSLLAEDLGLATIYQDEDTQNIIVVDYLYDVLMHVAKKGFSWEHAANALSVAQTMVSNSDKTLPEAIKGYKEECEAQQNILSPRELTVLTDYFFSTYFQHFKLYKFVFNNPQEKQTIGVDLHVETPPEHIPFSETKHVSIWEYEKKLEDLAAAEDKRKKQRQEENEKVETRRTEDVKKAIDAVNEPEIITDREKLVELIQSIASAHISAVSDKLNSSIEESLEELEYNLEKTSLPRPSELGAPPRVKTKSPPSAPSKRTKSATKSGKSRVTSGKKGKGK